MKYVNFDSKSSVNSHLKFSLVSYDVPKFLYDDKGNPSDPLHNIEKELNSNGFRSPEFAPVDLITLGCSQTFGMGVCSDFLWPKLLSEKLGNLSYANLSYPGWSVTRMVREFFAYVNIYGSPKFLSILMPDLYRYVFVTRNSVNIGYNVDKNKNVTDVTEGDLTLPVSEEFGWDEQQLPKISKKPHALEDILTPDFTHYQNLDSLYQLLIFCEATGVAVSISTWNVETNKIIKSLSAIGLNPEIVANYVSHDKHSCLDPKDPLHLDLKAKLTHPEEFDGGLDTGHHMGVHSHWHIADEMYKILKNQVDL